MMKLYQPFHLVTLSPWPIVMSFSLMMLLVSFILWFNQLNYLYIFISMFIMLIGIYEWWRDVIRESTYLGFHTINVYKGLKMGMILFIISEIFFFFSIFWCYFHLFLSPSLEVGSSFWPPKNIIMFNPYKIPLLNTIILLSSGVSITWSHYSILKSNKFYGMLSLLITLSLGVIFSFFQFIEYKDCSFCMSDSVYGSIFFMSTGFHGLHVFIGSIFLLINLIRMVKNNYSSFHHFGFEASVWYWHFVDVVWLFLYLLVYFWSY